ncbi:hypothetical protein [Stratiformator vulcanicus]|uniref:Uncharacterized protein n=1 Tax=Stratiformator vulcanicus TaxID=2527980 RepID=A0A517R7F0_9PLAN|nr:hypothetical protein [Stratiformator vulcanicus]QDT39816.1 hypothetical protein Pan189_42280 [Stratiformator vulcanicus]
MSSSNAATRSPTDAAPSTVSISRSSAERINLIRLISVAAFYAVEVLNYYNVSLGPYGFPDEVWESTHRSITAIASAWVLLGAASAFMPTQIRWFAAFETVADLLLLSLLMCVAGGPRGPMAVGYFLIIALSGLRFRLPLVRLATLGSIIGYLCVSGYARWYAVDPSELVVPRYHQVIVLIALGLCGVTIGQIVRIAANATGGNGRAT